MGAVPIPTGAQFLVSHILNFAQEWRLVENKKQCFMRDRSILSPYDFLIKGGRKWKIGHSQISKFDFSICRDDNEMKFDL